VQGARITLIVATIATFLGYAAAASAAVPAPEPTWTTNGRVNAIVATSDTVYIGGWFTFVGPRTGSGVPVDTTTGAAAAVFPEVNGFVRAAVPDGAGGFFIGGDFTRVGGVDRSKIAHVRADGTVDPSFDPSAQGGADSDVLALARSGSTLYVGGKFNAIGGQPRDNVAAISTTTGQATSWNPGADGSVSALVLAGSTVYLGGSFASVSGQSRSAIAAVNASTGTPTAWNPNVTGGGDDSQGPFVDAIALSGTTVYAGGEFNEVGTTARHNLAAISATSGAPTAWNPDPSGEPNDGLTTRVKAIAVSGSSVYVGGLFTSLGGAPRHDLGAVDATSGQATGWNPGVDGAPDVLAISGSSIYVGGSFDSITGTTLGYLAALDPSTGAARSWNPSPDATVDTLAFSGQTVYVGGSFNSVGAVRRDSLAALDARTGAATSWRPAAGISPGFSGAGPEVDALALAGRTLYVGGRFSSIGGGARANLAALDADTAALLPWNPGVSGLGPGGESPGVATIAVSGAAVYVGGAFSSAGGAPRNDVAALDTSTGSATGWDPSADHAVATLAATCSTIYAGGDFSSIGGQPRARIAALDPVTGAATSWDPEASVTSGGRPSEVLALAADGSVVYAGGEFDVIGGADRTNLAALDAASGNATGWQPAFGPQAAGVSALTVSGSTVVAGGGPFGPVWQPELEAFDAGTAAKLAWDPAPDSPVTALAVSPDGQTLYAGGLFTSIAGEPQLGGFAALQFPGPAGPQPSSGCGSNAPGTQPSQGAAPSPGPPANEIAPPPSGRLIGAVREHGGRLSFTFQCVTGACIGTATLSAHRARRAIVLGKRRFQVPPGQTATVTVPLGRAGRALLSRTHRLHATLAIKLGGTALVRRLGLTLTAPTRSHPACPRGESLLFGFCLP
jgi:hypothetical protein